MISRSNVRVHQGRCTGCGNERIAGTTSSGAGVALGIGKKHEVKQAFGRRHATKDSSSPACCTRNRTGCEGEMGELAAAVSPDRKSRTFETHNWRSPFEQRVKVAGGIGTRQKTLEKPCIYEKRLHARSGAGRATTRKGEDVRHQSSLSSERMVSRSGAIAGFSGMWVPGEPSSPITMYEDPPYAGERHLPSASIGNSSDLRRSPRPTSSQLERGVSYLESELPFASRANGGKLDMRARSESSDVHHRPQTHGAKAEHTFGVGRHTMECLRPALGQRQRTEERRKEQQTCWQPTSSSSRDLVKSVDPRSKWTAATPSGTCHLQRHVERYVLNNGGSMVDARRLAQVMQLEVRDMIRRSEMAEIEVTHLRERVREIQHARLEKDSYDRRCFAGMALANADAAAELRSHLDLANGAVQTSHIEKDALRHDLEAKEGTIAELERKISQLSTTADVANEGEIRAMEKKMKQRQEQEIQKIRFTWEQRLETVEQAHAVARQYSGGRGDVYLTPCRDGREPHRNTDAHKHFANDRKRAATFPSEPYATGKLAEPDASSEPALVRAEGVNSPSTSSSSFDRPRHASLPITRRTGNTATLPDSEGTPKPNTRTPTVLSSLSKSVSEYDPGPVHSSVSESIHRSMDSPTSRSSRGFESTLDPTSNCAPAFIVASGPRQTNVEARSGNALEADACMAGKIKKRFRAGYRKKGHTSALVHGLEEASASDKVCMEQHRHGVQRSRTRMDKNPEPRPEQRQVEVVTSRRRRGTSKARGGSRSRAYADASPPSRMERSPGAEMATGSSTLADIAMAAKAAAQTFGSDRDVVPGCAVHERHCVVPSSNHLDNQPHQQQQTFHSVSSLSGRNEFSGSTDELGERRVASKDGLCKGIKDGAHRHCNSRGVDGVPQHPTQRTLGPAAADPESDRLRSRRSDIDVIDNYHFRNPSAAFSVYQAPFDSSYASTASGSGCAPAGTMPVSHERCAPTEWGRSSKWTRSTGDPESGSRSSCTGSKVGRPAKASHVYSSRSDSARGFLQASGPIRDPSSTSASKTSRKPESREGSTWCSRPKLKKNSQPSYMSCSGSYSSSIERPHTRTDSRDGERSVLSTLPKSSSTVKPRSASMVSLGYHADIPTPAVVSHSITSAGRPMPKQFERKLRSGPSANCDHTGDPHAANPFPANSQKIARQNTPVAAISSGTITAGQTDRSEASRASFASGFSRSTPTALSLSPKRQNWVDEDHRHALPVPLLSTSSLTPPCGQSPPEREALASVSKHSQPRSPPADPSARLEGGISRSWVSVDSRTEYGESRGETEGTASHGVGRDSNHSGSRGRWDSEPGSESHSWNEPSSTSIRGSGGSAISAAARPSSSATSSANTRTTGSAANVVSTASSRSIMVASGGLPHERDVSEASRSAGESPRRPPPPPPGVCRSKTKTHSENEQWSGDASTYIVAGDDGQSSAWKMKGSSAVFGSYGSGSPSINAAAGMEAHERQAQVRNMSQSTSVTRVGDRRLQMRGCWSSPSSGSFSGQASVIIGGPEQSCITTSGGQSSANVERSQESELGRGASIDRTSSSSGSRRTWSGTSARGSRRRRTSGSWSGSCQQSIDDPAAVRSPSKQGPLSTSSRASGSVGPTWSQRNGKGSVDLDCYDSRDLKGESLQEQHSLPSEPSILPSAGYSDSMRFNAPSIASRFNSRRSTALSGTSTKTARGSRNRYHPPDGVNTPDAVHRRSEGSYRRLSESRTSNSSRSSAVDPIEVSPGSRSVVEVAMTTAPLEVLNTVPGHDRGSAPSDAMACSSRDHTIREGSQRSERQKSRSSYVFSRSASCNSEASKQSQATLEGSRRSNSRRRRNVRSSRCDEDVLDGRVEVDIDCAKGSDYHEGGSGSQSWYEGSALSPFQESWPGSVG